MREEYKVDEVAFRHLHMKQRRLHVQDHQGFALEDYRDATLEKSDALDIKIIQVEVAHGGPVVFILPG